MERSYQRRSDYFMGVLEGIAIGKPYSCFPPFLLDHGPMNCGDVLSSCIMNLITDLNVQYIKIAKLFICNYFYLY